MEDNRGGKERGRGERSGGRLGIVRLGAHRDNRSIVGLMRFEFEKASPLSEPLFFPKKGSHFLETFHWVGNNMVFLFWWEDCLG